MFGYIFLFHYLLCELRLPRKCVTTTQCVALFYFILIIANFEMAKEFGKIEYLVIDNRLFH